MVNINFGALNELEQKIHETITRSSKEYDSLTINESAELCGCSISKISKFVQKLGFENYKQYMQYIYGGDIQPLETSEEFDRIKDFLNHYDHDVTDYFVELISNYERIVLLGYGTTYYTLQYFGSKLQVITNKNVVVPQDTQTAESTLMENTLLLCFSLSGKFLSFADIYQKAHQKGATCVVVLEEYNTDVLNEYDNVIFLTQHVQPYPWTFHEKSRIIFFVFIEEIMNKIIANQYEAEKAAELAALEAEKVAQEKDATTEADGADSKAKNT